MKRIVIGLLLVMLLGVAPIFGLDQVPGSQYLLTGRSVKSYSLGFTGLSELGNIDGMTINPAAMGDLRRLANSISVIGIGSDNFLGSAAVALPTDIGVISLNMLYLSSKNTNAFDYLLGGTLNISKSITEQLFWGFSLNYAKNYLTSGNDFLVTFDMGIIHQNKADTKGFGFNNFALGVALKNIGKNFSKGDQDGYPLLGLGVGASFLPFKFENYSMKLYSDVSVGFNPMNVVLGFGMENTILKMFKLRVGYTINNDNIGMEDMGSLTLGAGFSGVIKLKEETDVDISYALLNHEFNGKKETSHSLNIAIAWGYYDDKKPSVKIKPSATYFSPNLDGSNDTVKLNMSIADNRLVDSWKVTIVNGDSHVVKEFKNIDKLKLQDMSVKKAIGAIFARKQEVAIPRFVEWNGEDLKGKQVPDGKYIYKLEAWDNNKNVAVISGAVYIDKVVPLVKSKSIIENKIFSPNNDGSKETISFDISTSSIQKGDTLIAQVLDSDKKVIRSYFYKDQLPTRIKWDGKDKKRADVKEGDYSFKVIVKDRAGNKTENIIENIKLVRKYEKVFSKPVIEAFAPTRNGVKDLLAIRTKVSNTKGLESWVLKIYDIDKKVVREIKGGKNIPVEVLWDGKDTQGNALKDGFYSFDISLKYDSGNHPVSIKEMVELDTTPVAIEVKPQYLSFSPNFDKKKDALIFETKLKGNKNDEAELKILNSSGQEIYSKSYLVKDFPRIFKWKGLDKKGKPLPEGIYSFVVDTIDRVGNKKVVTIANITLKTGLEKISSQSSEAVISPGNKKGKNSLEFKNKVSSTKDIEKLTLEIKNKSGKVIKKFESGTYLPVIKWDGKGSDGKKVKDGSYSYKLTVKYKYGDEPVSVEKNIRIDTKPPKVKQFIKDYFFSPNGDGRKETIEIKQSVKGDKKDIYKGYLLDSNNRKVKNYLWTGKVPATLKWDGKSDNGKPLPPGKYRYVLEGSDIVNNRSQQKSQIIELVRAFETVNVSYKPGMFSPNKDGQDDKLIFIPKVSSQKGLVKSELVIYDIARKQVKKFTKLGSMPSSFVWNGDNSSGSFEKDGEYSAELTCYYQSGNKISGKATGIKLDANPPVAAMTIGPSPFTPDGDGDYDKLFLNVRLRDFSAVGKWSINIYKKKKKGMAVAPFKTFTGVGSGKNFKQMLEWDGYNDKREDVVESVQDYVAVLNASDTMGNKMTPLKRNITVGVLVERTKNGLRIRVSSVRFGSGASRLKRKSKRNLDKVIYIIRRILSDPKKYGLTADYKIIVSGHTDDVGDAKYNDRLSKRRAYSVYRYLKYRNISGKVLSYKGYGENNPYKKIDKATMDKEKIKLYRSRNRRVEFFIKK